MTGAKSLSGLLRLAGERQRAEAVALHELGLSPLARGTDHATVDARLHGRFIPRSRGEQEVIPQIVEGYGGLSPLARGTDPDKDARHSTPRFIPARAGNSSVLKPLRIHRSVYPRSRGEQALTKNAATGADGLSPLARGTAQLAESGVVKRRFIPARAGNGKQNPV